MEFTYCKLIDVLSDIHSGGTPSTEESSYWGGNIKWLSSSETSQRFISDTVDKITEEGVKNSSTKLAKKNNIVMACAGQGKTRGQTSYLLDDMYINQSVIALETNASVLPLYLFYNLSSRYEELRGGSDASSTRGSITTTALKNLPFKYPDLSTQQSIVDTLFGYDSLIEANNRRIELLEQTAQELYKEWFVRFRFPGYENTKFENGLPEGWQIKRIGNLFDITSSKRVYLADYVDDGVPFYRSKEIIQLSQGQSITEPLYISNEAFRNFKNKFGAPEKNDILITSVGTIGVSYLVDGHEFYFKDGNLTWIKSSSDKRLSLYLFQWLNSQSGKQQLLQSTIGTSQSALTIENLKKIKLLVPTKKLVEDYYQKTHVMLEQKRALQMKNQNLAKQRDMLLPRLMSGKLEV